MTFRFSSSARGALGVLFSASLVGAMGSGCSAPSDDEDVAGVGQITSPIINGTNSTSAQDAVVLLFISSGRGGGNCTGTLVAPNLVLTARHCVSSTDEGSVCKANGDAIQGGAIYSNYSAGNIAVFTGVNANPYGSSSPAAVGKKIVVDDDAKTICNDDVAFLVLDRNVSGAKIAPLRLTHGARQGEKLTAVGWGLTEAGRMPSRRMQRTGVEVLAAGPISFEGSPVGIGDSEFVVGESICSGDSGGPAFSAKGAIVGVVSRGGNGSNNPSSPASGCKGEDTLNWYTQLVMKGELVERAFTAAGATPLDEGPMPGAENGAACAADGDCSQGVCALNKCATGCRTDDDCASNEECRAKFGKNVCTTKKSVPPAKDDAGAPPGDTDPGDTDPDLPTDSPDENPADGMTTITTTKTGCATSPSPSGTSGLAGWLVGLGVVLAARRRRS